MLPAQHADAVVAALGATRCCRGATLGARGVTLNESCLASSLGERIISSVEFGCRVAVGQVMTETMIQLLDATSLEKL